MPVVSSSDLVSVSILKLKYNSAATSKGRTKYNEPPVTYAHCPEMNRQLPRPSTLALLVYVGSAVV